MTNTRLTELKQQAMRPTGLEGLGGPYKELDEDEFAKAIVAECVEIVRDVLREEGSTLSYEDADKIQKKMKENLGISW